MRLLYALTLACLVASPAFAVEVRKGQGTPAPTQAVSSNNLVAPVFQSDTRNLEAILDKEETARVTRDATAAAAVPAAAKPKSALPAPLVTVPASPVVPQAIPTEPESEGFFSSLLMGLRVFSIRWREMFDIFFTLVLLVYVRKLYLLSREQHKILSHSIRSAEYSAAAAKRAADICETLLKSQEKPDEAQHQLDL